MMGWTQALSKIFMVRLWNNFGRILICFGIFAWQPLSIPVKSREHSGVVFGDSYQKEHQCLVGTIYHEARGESEEGQRAVLQVILNRKNHKNFPSTICGVVKQDKQFSFLNKGLHRLDVKPVEPLDKFRYSQISSMAHEALQGRFKAVLEPSVLYYAHVRVKNQWTRRMKVVMIHGQHKFYKEI